MITIQSQGDWKNTQKYLERMSTGEIFKLLEKYGQQGVTALATATPIDSGATANSWDYEVQIGKGLYSIIWTNDNVVHGQPIAILIQYGHGTGTGGWVEGRDYINPAIKPIFDRILNEVWREVTSS